MYKGKRPKKPATTELALREMITVSEDWLRRDEQAWFDPEGIPVTDLGFMNSGDVAAIPELCDCLDGILGTLSRRAREVRGELKELKASAQQRIANQSKSTPTKSKRK